VGQVIWEMDFYTAPLRDERDKRVWELLVCDSTGQFQQARYCSNQEVNSLWVEERLQEFLALAPAKPTAIRAFRPRMTSIMQRGCEAVGLPLRPSRRVYALQRWRQEREQQVYPQETAYTYTPEDRLEADVEQPDPIALPDKLRGERWALVSLKVEDLAAAADWPAEFRDLFAVTWQNYDADTPVPGMVMASPRALPMAAWMSGSEPAFIQYISDPQPLLILEAGQNDRYILARLGNPSLQAEATGFEQQKEVVDGLHFLAIQTDLQAQAFAGFWLLQDPTKVR
jgi:hypothetical protein